ncbi:MAG TPA: hypothetical protein VGR65_13770 [Casimicrobiaceae bacterium]|nr:hypothetical protein [Casimicrobiaceae bacterium]
MSDLGISSIAFACVSGATLLGLFLHDLLPSDHLSEGSKDTVKLGMGMVATLAALVLGLLIGFATDSFNKMRSEVQHTAAKLIVLDRVLAHYGPEAKEIRDLLRRSTAARIETIWSEGGFRPSSLARGDSLTEAEGVQDKLRQLSPRTDAQRWLQSQALSLSAELAQTRWLLIAESESPIPTLLLAVLIFWIAIIFLSFALFAPRNATVLVTLLVCALSVSGSIFVMLELNHPFHGAIKISSAPMRDALARLGQ